MTILRPELTSPFAAAAFGSIEFAKLLAAPISFPFVLLALGSFTS